MEKDRRTSESGKGSMEDICKDQIMVIGLNCRQSNIGTSGVGMGGGVYSHNFLRRTVH